MATTLYFRVAVADFTFGDQRANLRGNAVSWVHRSLSTARGASATSETVITIASNTSGLEIAQEVTDFISPPLDADVTIAGNITFNLRGAESSMSANAALGCVIQRLDSVGATQETVYSGKYTTAELGTSEGAQNWTADATDTTFHKGDRIRIRVFAGNYGTMGGEHTVTHYFDGPTGGASGDSYVTFTETLGFLTSAAAGTTLYLTDTASAVSTAAVDREAWTSRGGGVANDVTNTTTGYTAPIQVTDTAGGTVVDWWTRQLTAFTLGGRVDANIRAALSATNTNAIVRVEIAVCASDGSSPTVWAAANEYYRDNTSEEARTVVLSGDDVSVTSGQRLRIRLYIDDGRANTVQQLQSMITGRTVTTYYAGTSGGATGDTYLTLTQSVTEYVPAVQARTLSGGAVVFQDPGIL